MDDDDVFVPESAAKAVHSRRAYLCTRFEAQTTPEEPRRSVRPTDQHVCARCRI